jgi:DNA (cytosine-5)-methyltransferase 1
MGCQVSMAFGSVCSGIEAASVAWGPLGWKAAWLSEIEPFPSAVLAHHYPDVPNLGDMTLLPERILSGEVEAPDVFCGGTPCQAFSVAGLRNSLDDARGNLSLVFCEIANAIDKVRSVQQSNPCIIFWENVPGVLSTKDNAFGCFLGALAGEDDALIPPGGRWTNAGFIDGPKRAVAWRVLDAQYFGVAQRRKRVFVVASARADFDPAAVLFEFDGVRRDSAPSRQAGKDITPSTGAGAAISIHPHCIGRAPEAGPQGKEYLLDGSAYCMDSRGQPQAVAQPIPLDMRNAGRDPEKHDEMNRQGVGVGEPGDPAHTVTSAFVHAVAQPMVLMDQGDSVMNVEHDIVGTLRRETHGHEPAVIQPPSMAVRRLTPVECERLQGFPDNYTNIPWRKKDESPDGPRYKALGNSWAVPVVRWIGDRIAKAA